MDFPLPPKGLKSKPMALPEGSSHVSEPSDGTLPALQAVTGEFSNDMAEEIASLHNHVKMSKLPEQNVGQRTKGIRPALSKMKDLLGDPVSNLALLNLDGASRNFEDSKNSKNGDKPSLRRGSFLSFVSNSRPPAKVKTRKTPKTLRSNGNESQSSRKQPMPSSKSSQGSRSKFSVDQSLVSIKSATRSQRPKLQPKLSFSGGSLLSRPANASLKTKDAAKIRSYNKPRPSINRPKRMLSSSSVTEMLDERDLDYSPCGFEPEDDDADRKMSELFYKTRLGRGDRGPVKDRKYSLFDDSEQLKPRRISASMLSEHVQPSLKPEKDEEDIDAADDDIEI